jgi:hypothetical protein
MEFTLKGALKKYRRMRLWRRAVVTLIFGVGIAGPWLFGFDKTDALICVVGAMLVYFAAEIELRLKTIQIRLADMADEITEMRGKEPERNLILELNDW